jgi:hypothetical protein
MTALRSIGVELKIWKTPVEFDDSTPFDQDHHHASYDREYVERFHRILFQTARILTRFRSG